MNNLSKIIVSFLIFLLTGIVILNIILIIFITTKLENIPKPQPLFQLLPKIKLSPTEIPMSTPTSIPPPKIFNLIDQYKPPKITAAASYTLIFMGDSMTESLGENSDFLRLDLTKY